MKKYSAFVLLVFIVAGACKQQDKSAAVTDKQPNKFINPPIKGVDVPYKEYTVDAAAGDTLTHPNGSVLVFPPNSFVDEGGNAITGKVQVKYREFTDPIDFFLAGIPMQYDSAGKTYSLASPGMMEILAYKDGKPVFVNQKSKPQIALYNSNKEQGQRVYRLDTVLKKWINQATLGITKPATQAPVANSPVNTTGNITSIPVKPLKADNKSPVMEIVVDPNSFQEFAAYKGLKFQVDESKTPLNPRDSSEEWNNLELVKGNGKGNYLAKFSNAKKTATYAVKPVFEGDDYNKALQTFEKENTTYKQQVVERARAAQTNEMARQREERITAAKEWNAALRVFYVDGFGVWGSNVAEAFNFHYINATFKTEDGETLNPDSYIAIYVRGFNGCISTNAEHLGVKLGADNMILSVYKGRFAYESFAAFKKLNITADTNAQTFIMKVVTEKDNNYEFIKRVAMQ
jgi:hypothetical protein